MHVYICLHGLNERDPFFASGPSTIPSEGLQKLWGIKNGVEV